jgi:hypothetical protein
MPSEVFGLKESTINQLLQEQNDTEYNVFYIPSYQRKYSWKQENWDQFFLDIEDHMEDPEELRDLFLGTIITLNNANSTKIMQIHDLIDGQQRLTTILIFYVAILEKLKELQDLNDNNKRKSQRLMDELTTICAPERLVHRNDLLSPGAIETMYQRLHNTILGSTVLVQVDRRSKYFLAYKTFANKLHTKLNKQQSDDEKFAMINQFVVVVKRSRIIWATVSELSFAIEMFDVLNSRGQPLNVTDIIKTSYLTEMLHKYKIIRIPEQNIVEWVDGFWKSLVQIFDAQKNDFIFRRFLRHYYILCKQSSILENRMPDVYKVWFDQIFNEITPTIMISMNQFEKNILRSAAIYGFILDPIKSKLPSHLDLKYLEKLKSVPHPITSIEKTITEMIYDISKLELVQINLLILCVIDIFSSGNFQQNEYNNRIVILKKIINNILRFVIRRNLTDEPRPNKMDGLVLEIIKEINKDNSVLEKLKKADECIVTMLLAKSEHFFAAKLDDIQYSSSNLNLLFLLHILEKWSIANNDGTYILRDHQTVFDAFEVTTSNKQRWQIEHILPQSFSNANDQGNTDIDDDDDDDNDTISVSAPNDIKKWIDSLNEWGSNLVRADKEQRLKSIHSLGNLTLIEHNASLGAKILKEKQDFVKNHQQVGYKANFPNVLNRIIKFANSSNEEVDLTTTTIWTEKEIDKRSIAMVEHLKNLLR